MEGIERREFSWGVVFNSQWVTGEVCFESIIRDANHSVNWSAVGKVSPAEARAFAQRIIAVADAVEAELKETTCG